MAHVRILGVKRIPAACELCPGQLAVWAAPWEAVVANTQDDLVLAHYACPDLREWWANLTMYPCSLRILCLVCGDLCLACKHALLCTVNMTMLLSAPHQGICTLLTCLALSAGIKGLLSTCLLGSLERCALRKATAMK